MKPLTLEEIILLKERFSNGQHTTRGQVALLIETARAAMEVVEAADKIYRAGKMDSLYVGITNIGSLLTPFRQEKK